MMKVSLGGLSSAIKGALRGPRKRELAYMVDEAFRHISRLDVLDEAIEELLADDADSLAVHRTPGYFSVHYIQRGSPPERFYHHENLVAALTLAVDGKREQVGKIKSKDTGDTDP